jgi:hypothetical protein
MPKPLKPRLTFELTGIGNSWGTWGNRVSCPEGSYICVIKTRVEAYQGKGDDTALNEATFYCCTFKETQWFVE